MPGHLYIHPVPTDQGELDLAYAAADIIDEYCGIRDVTGGLLREQIVRTVFIAVSVYGLITLPLPLESSIFFASFEVYDPDQEDYEHARELKGWDYIGRHTIQTPNLGIRRYRIRTPLGFELQNDYTYDPGLSLASQIVMDNLRGARSRQGTANQTIDLLAGARELVNAFRAP